MQSNIFQQAPIFHCWCKQQISSADENHLFQHIAQCNLYHNGSPFYQKFSELPLDRMEMVHLIAMKNEFLNMIRVVQLELSRRGYQGANASPCPACGTNFQPKTLQPNGSQRNPFSPNSIVRANPVPLVPKDLSRQEDDFMSLEGRYDNPLSNNSNHFGLANSRAPFDPTAFLDKQNMTECEGCKNKFDSNFDTDKFWFLQECCHTFCKVCLNKQIKSEYLQKNGEVRCRVCGAGLTSEDYAQLIGRERKEELDEKLLEQQCNIVACIKCHSRYSIEPGKIGNNIKDSNGKMLSREHEQHYVQNRFICQNVDCKTEQCKSCHTVPYHMGYTCEAYEKFKLSKRCRYCDTTIKLVDTSQPLALQDICRESDCVQKSKNACTKILPCGHSCTGYKDEVQCLPCLSQECAEKNDHILMGQRGEDFCNICFVEGLSTAPCVRSACGHIFHYHCIKKRLEFRWTSARITFNFCLCALCKAWMEFRPDCEFAVEMQKNLAMFEDIKHKSTERLKFEERLKDEKLINPSSQYYGKQTEYAIAIYAYYLCFKCKKPYFGGHKDCQQAMDDGRKDFKPEELVCANCCDIPAEDCPKHGKEFIEFKCKFCCSIAQWFCWGTTHFCDSCHKRQCAGDYVSKYTKDKLPKCSGKKECPLKADHKANGDECSLGCSVCRNMKENAREF